MQASRLWALVSLLWPALAAAHPGHGATADGWSALHWLLEPLHLPAAALALIVLAAGARRALRSRASRSGS
jgi:hypothetical protein